MPKLRAACLCIAQGVLRCRSHLDRVTLCACRTSETALAFCLLHSPFFLLPLFLLPRPVSQRLCPGGVPDMPPCISHVARVILCGCGTCKWVLCVSLCDCGTLPITIVTLRFPPPALPAHSLPTKCCCPVSRPDWFRRGRLRRFAPSAMQASCCSSVSEWLYLLEAAPRRVRQRRCLKERGSLGFTQRRRHCLPPRSTYHT